MRVFTRYDFPDSEGDTRRDRNTRVGVETPEFYLPTLGKYLWEWFGDLNNSVSRLDSNAGVCNLIPPSEYLAWSTLTGNEINHTEFEILRAMDAVYCKEINAEIFSERNKREEKLKEEINSKKRGVKHG